MSRTNAARLSLAALAIALTAGVAAAGRKESWPVGVDVTNRMAYGAMGSARNAADTVEFINCYTTSYATYTYGVCYVGDAAGHQGMCWTTNATLDAGIASIGTDDFVMINWDASNACTSINVQHGSLYAPKAP